MNDEAFEQIRKIVYDNAGISLSDQKKTLVETRLAKRKRTLGLTDDMDYVRLVKKDKTGQELIILIDSISTNVTHFFRESVQFDFTRKVVGQWLEQGQSRMRFWSAASSTGEEPYTLGMVLMDVAEAMGCRPDMRILGTDISTRVLALCKRGIYDQGKLKTVDEALRRRFFDSVQEEGKTCFQVKPCLRKMVKFGRINLSSPPFPMRGPLDIVFCRNVMIYFDNETRMRLLSEIYRLLKPGGYLMVGQAEGLSQELIGDFNRVGPSIYLKAA